MKITTFKNGTLKCKSYLKQIGNCYEVGFTYGSGNPVFLGTFTKSGDASKWYTFMNKEIRKFGKQYPIGPAYPATWFKQFIAHHLYTRYLRYSSKLLAAHERTVKRAVVQDIKKYKKLKAKWPAKVRKPSLRKAA